jgi:hypothetical protein
VNSNAYQTWLSQQKESGVASGMIDPQTGWPTANALVDAAHQWGSAMIAGTGAPGEGFTAYHGSPHSFDQFQSSAIGTGEGAQAYGHGLYFADQEAIAKGYRDKLSSSADMSLTDARGNRVDVPPGIAAGTAIAHLENGDGNYEQAFKSLYDQHDYLTAKRAAMDPTKYDTSPPTEDTKAAADMLNSWRQQGLMLGKPGSMYQVQVNADPAHFLDWDKPRDQLAPDVQAFAKQNTPQAWENAADGSSLYHGMAKELGSPADASAAMARAGIPGIRYLDGGSRADGQGTSNHVIFDPATIGILRKYGIAGLMAGGAAAASGHKPTQ